MLPTVRNYLERFSKCPPVAVSAAWRGSSHSVLCTIRLNSSTCFTCILLHSISGLLALPCKHQQPPGWHLGRFGLISDGPKSSSDDLQGNLIFSMLQQRFPFPTTLTLNFAFMWFCSNDYRFGKELQAEKAQTRENTPIPSP